MTIAEPRAAPETRRLPRLLRSPAPDAATHLATFGPLPQGLRIPDVQRSGITGRGGAGFPVARKLAAMGPGGVVIGNGSEGEPLSGKDALLLTTAPHLVIDGLLLAAGAVAAAETVLVVQPALEGRMREALAERPDGRRVTLRLGGGGFVSGEASALVNGIATGRRRPTDHPVRLTESGLRRRPTLVQNVETLAHLALIGRYGPDWFTELGTRADPGSRLLTLAGDVPQPGVIEAPGGVSVRTAIAAGGADPGSVRAVLVGGYHGAWVTDLGLCLGTEAARGVVPAGAGVLSVLGRGRCGLEATAGIADYLAGQSAGQCGPCLNGLPAMAGVLTRIARFERDGHLAAEAVRLAKIVTGSGACHHPDGTAHLVRSALTVFADDVRAHLRGTCLEAAR